MRTRIDPTERGARSRGRRSARRARGRVPSGPFVRSAGRTGRAAPSRGPLARRRERPGRPAPRRELRPEVPAGHAGGGRVRRRRRGLPPRAGFQRRAPRRGVRRGDARPGCHRPRVRRRHRRDRRVLARERIFTLVDLHQDGYGPLTHGNGFPAWATLTDGLPNPPDRSRPTTCRTPRCNGRSTTSGPTSTVPTACRCRSTTRPRCASSPRSPTSPTCSATTR